MPGNNDISLLDSLLPALNIKQQQQKNLKKILFCLILFLLRLGNITLWFPLDHILLYNFWKYSLIRGNSTLKYGIQCFYLIHKDNHLNRETVRSEQNPTPSRQ